MTAAAKRLALEPWQISAAETIATGAPLGCFVRRFHSSTPRLPRLKVRRVPAAPVVIVDEVAQ